MKQWFLITILFSVLFSTVFAQEKFEIEAKVLKGNVNEEITAEGNVEILYGEVILKGDKAYYNREKGILRLEGNVFIKEGNTELFCDRLVYDLKLKKAVLTNVYGKLSPVDYIKAKRIERISERKWVAYDGVYTPCSQECPDWSIGARKFDVLVGEGIKGKWVSFRIKNVPVLFLPFIASPIIKERKTGFLFPRFGYRKDDGLIYKQPFYVVLGRSADLTLTYEKRTRDGDSRNAEFRYILSENNKGNLFYSLIRRDGRKDWKLTFSHRFFPDEQFYGSMSSELINSRTYFISSQTFDPEEKTKIYTKSNITFSKLWKHAILNVNAVYLHSLDGSTDTIYQRLPNVRFYLLDIPLGNTPFSFSNDLDFTYFYRKAGDSGYRVNVQPTLVFGKKWKNLKSSSRFSVLLTKYQHGGKRSIVQFKNTLSTHHFLPMTEKFLISLNPRLEATYREEEDQSSNPFYDTTDRIEGEKSLNGLLDSFIYYSGKRIMRLSLKTFYDFQDKNNHLGLWKLDLDISPSQKFSFKETLFYSPKDSELKKVNTYFSTKWKVFSLWLNHYYEFDNEVLNNYLRWGASVPLGKYLTFSYSQRYDLLLSMDREREYALFIKRGCWNGRFSYRWVRNYDNTLDYQIMLVVNLLKVGNYGYRFLGKKE